MLTCRQATTLASRALDGSLDLRRRCALRLHLLLCRLCRRYARQLGHLREASRRLTRGTVPSSLATSLPEPARQRLRRLIDDRLTKAPHGDRRPGEDRYDG